MVEGRNVICEWKKFLLLSRMVSKKECLEEEWKRYMCGYIVQETLTLAVLCALLTSPAFTDANYLHG